MSFFDVSKEDAILINKICERGFVKLKQDGLYGDRLSMIMDISAVHANCHSLRLQELLSASEFDFYHDLTGVVLHLNRETCKLENGFLPRFLT